MGTFAWAAPEVLLGRPCTEKVDIYSYGVMLWELSAGEAPPGRHLRPLRCCSCSTPAKLHLETCAICGFDRRWECSAACYSE